MSSTLDPLDIPDLLANLVERSLVAFDERSGRYRLSETLRAFATEQLGEDMDSLRQKHFSYFLARSDQIGELIKDWDDKALSMCFSDADNFRTAMQWGFGRPQQSSEVLVLVSNLGGAWGSFNHWEAREFLEMSLQLPTTDMPECRAWIHLMMVSDTVGHGAFEEAEKFLALAKGYFSRNGGDPRGMLHVLLRETMMLDYQDRTEEAYAIAERMLPIVREHRLTSHEAIVLIHTGELCRRLENLDLADSYYERARTLTDNDFLLSTVHFNLGSTALLREQWQRAVLQLKEVIRISLKFDEAVTIVKINLFLAAGFVAIILRDYGSGLSLIRHGQEVGKRRGTGPDPSDVVVTEMMIGKVRENWAEYESAMRESIEFSLAQATDLSNQILQSLSTDVLNVLGEQGRGE